MGNGELWPPTEIQTPQPIAEKIVTVDYVCEMNHYANLGANPSTEASGQMGEYNVKLFLHTYTQYPFFRATSHRSDRSTNFDA